MSSRGPGIDPEITQREAGDPDVSAWVGASAGLGYIMLNANARMQTDTAFAALFILALLAVLLWQVVDRLLKRVLYWVPDSGASF